MTTMKDKIIPTGKVCGRKGCNELGIHKVNSNGSRYCPKHYRFSRMRIDAKYAGKAVPTWDECEGMLPPCLNDRGELGLCPNCNRQMIWRAGPDRKMGATISLQHDNNGPMHFVCTSCNGGHGNSKLGDQYFKLDDNEKLCPDCNTIKSLDQFNKSATSPSGLQSVCRDCAKERNRKRLDQINADPVKRANYLAKMREYKRKRYAAKKTATTQLELD